MDWANDPELIEIFESEMRERSERLARCCRALANRALPESRFTEALRDAHTIKGNAAVMGHRKVSDAMAIVEDAWTSVVDGLGIGGSSFGNLMAEVVDRTMAALDEPGIMEPHIVALCNANGVALPSSWVPAVQTSHPVVAARFAVEQPLSESVSESVSERVVAGTSQATFHSLANDQPDLGGLLGTWRGLMVGETVRVAVPRLRTVVEQGATVRLDAEALVVALRRFIRPGDQEGWMKASDGLLREMKRLQSDVESLGMEQVSSITQSVRQLGVYLARRQGKEVVVEIAGNQLEIDRGLLDLLREPLRHLVVNAVEHGIEPVAERVAAGKSRQGKVTISFTEESGTLRVVVTDDGSGVDWTQVEAEAVERELTETGGARAVLTSALFERGFSTAAAGGDFSGDGSGLDLVSEAVSMAHGGLLFDTQPGLGSRVEMRVPSSVALQDLLSIECAGERWSLPVASIVGVHDFEPASVSPGLWQPEYLYEGRRIPFASLSEALALESGAPVQHVVILASRGARIAVGISVLHGVRKAALRRLRGVMSGIDFLAGMGVLGGGETVAVIDPDYLGALLSRPRPQPGQRPKVLVVDDSLAVRQVMIAGLTSIGFDVDATDGVESGLALFSESDYDAVVIDLYLEDGDGIEFVDEVRSLSAEIPIVMVSGVAHPVDRQRALAAGANFFFDKADLRKGAFVSTLQDLATNVEQAPV